MSDRDKDLLERLADLLARADDTLCEMTDPLPLQYERLWQQVQCGLLTAREGVSMMRHASERRVA